MKSMTKLMVVAMILVAALVVAPAAAARDVADGNTIYVGEDNLNLTGVFGSATTGTLEFAYGESNQKTIRVGSPSSFDLLAASVGSTTGRWYAYNETGQAIGTSVLIDIPSSRLDVVLDQGTTSVDGKSVTRGQPISFRLINNLEGLGNDAVMDIEITTPGGGVVTQFGDANLSGVLVTDRHTDMLDLTNVTTGTYTARGVLQDVDFTGTGFDTNTVTFEVGSGSITLESNKDTVVRGNSFTVTVTGESKHTYYLTIRNPGDNAPVFREDQVGVINNSAANVSVETTAAGTRPVELITNQSTRDATYTLRVTDSEDETKYDEVRVKVEQGAMTITTSGTGTYYVGEEIVLSGTNTDSNDVYLFVTGPNLGNDGVRLTGDMDSVRDVGATHVDVEADDTWSYRWNTADIRRALTSGGYTVYAVSDDRTRGDLSGAKYATATVQLRPGFITATLGSATVAKGEDVTITGTAQGNPTAGVNIWIFGKNFYGDPNTGNLEVRNEHVESDGSFEFELDGSITQDLTAGQYFVVVQHPMGSAFEVEQGTGTNINSIFRANETGVNNVFVARLTNLQASEAANALIDALESPYVNDAYTKLTFFLDNAWIRIDPIGDQSAGSTFTITGTTNIAAGEELIVEVTSAAFQPGTTGETNGFSSDAGSVTVQQGETANTWSFEVDATSFRPDQYIVSVESIQADTSTTGSFNVVEGPAPTPTATVTTTPTGTETTPTGTTTTEPTPTQSPGFGALVALAGLGAVAFLVLRRD
ncbi:MEMAR_RS02690 family S-layer glycoprotein [Methanoculleus sp.]|uniref:MEMAR_RS02690 family S-layer glycoprotein n=1 Tax=Methanoculleus sp. TaxID=90427 RepID=UPI0025E2688A|nr:MEMAR_RS02690 family S-layer glycoprotein [Methanoculleus sp.]